MLLDFLFTGPRDTETLTTLHRMRYTVLKDRLDPAVRQISASIVGTSSAQTPRAQIRAIRTYLADSVLFVFDPVGVEFWLGPRELLTLIAREGYVHGDCDDIAVLGAAMGRAVGYPARFVAAAYGEAPMSHVWVELLDPYAGWTELDVSRDAQRMGDIQPTRVLTLEV